MEILENYLSLSKELCPLNILTPSSTTNNNIQDDIASTIDNNPSSTPNMELSTSTNETNLTTTPVINKKLSRPSFNSFEHLSNRFHQLNDLHLNNNDKIQTSIHQIHQ
jgi:hypothetical protein